MKLFKVEIAILAPAQDAEGAKNRFIDQYDSTESIVESLTVHEIVPHEDFIKLFRLGRILDKIDQFSTFETISLVTEYAKLLGYILTVDEVSEGIIAWCERLEDIPDEELEDWLN